MRSVRALANDAADGAHAERVEPRVASAVANDQAMNAANADRSSELLHDPRRLATTIAFGVCSGLLSALQIATGTRRAVPSPPTGPVVSSTASEVMSADEVAAMLKLDRKTVYDYAGRGEIPCRRIGKRLLFSREALALWLGSCSKRSSEGDSK